MKFTSSMNQKKFFLIFFTTDMYSLKLILFHILYIFILCTAILKGKKLEPTKTRKSKEVIFVLCLNYKEK